jgi:hypothetical protein
MSNSSADVTVWSLGACAFVRKYCPDNDFSVEKIMTLGVRNTCGKFRILLLWNPRSFPVIAQLKKAV